MPEQWRAVGFEGLSSQYYYGTWRDGRSQAERDLGALRSARPPFDDVYLETRQVRYGIPARVAGERREAV